MSGKRRHRERLAALEERAQKLRLDSLARGIVVDPEALAPNNGYSVAPDFVSRGYYVDKDFVCRDCGDSEIWTAEQQKWWYEVAKRSVYSEASRCPPCRRRHREQKGDARFKGGVPNP